MTTTARSPQRGQASCARRSCPDPRAPHAMEETVCIVKPDAVLAGLTDRVLGAAEDDGFYVVRRAEKRLTPARARAFYQHLEGTNAFRPAAEFLASGPVVVAVLSKVDAVRGWRERVGPTDPDVARERHPKSIRAQLGVDALRNVVHASATVQDAAREKAFLFPSGPLPGLVPKEYLLETLVMPGLVEALGELYVAQPPDPYAWMAHWFAVNDPPSAAIAEEWPSPCLRPQDALEEAASAESCHRHTILGAPMYDGTWNFRRCKDRDPVYGVGACDVDGARAVVDGLRKSGHREIAWTFLADEPLVYVGGEPAVVALNAADEREDSVKAKSFRASLETTRTNDATATKNSFELERLEARLKSDVLASAAAAAAEAGGGAVGFVRVLGKRAEGDGGDGGARRAAPSVREVDEAQIEHDAKRNGGIPDPRALASAAEVFAALGVTGSPSRYLRAPVAARAAPSERQFERVVRHVLSVDEDAALVFACGDGVHRATVGMVAGCLVWRARLGELEAFRDDASQTGATRAFSSTARPDHDACEFFPVTSMLERLRPLGLSRAKHALDAVVHACDAVFDVRAAAGECRAAAAAEGKKEETEGDARGDAGAGAEHARKGLACLERYCWLLLFAAYCVDCGSAGFETSFGAWTRSRWSLRPKTSDMVLA